MSQLNWTVLGDVGDKFHVGMYHGETSGHLVVYCNWKIIIVDFSVLQSKTYSFYLGHEFCHLNIEKLDSGFRYALEKDIEANTPLNIARQKAERQDSIKSGMLLIALIFTIVVIVYFYKTIS